MKAAKTISPCATAQVPSTGQIGADGAGATVDARTPATSPCAADAPNRAFESPTATPSDPSRRETLADIVAEKRRRADEIEAAAKPCPNQFQRELIADLRKEADRIEEANETTLIAARGAYQRLAAFHEDSARLLRYLCDCYDAAITRNDLTLREPRNCDRFATVHEAGDAWHKWLDNFSGDERRKAVDEMPLHVWLFAPADAGTHKED